MPLVKHEDAIKEYYNSIKEKFPQLTYEECYKICSSPFKSIIAYMRDERLPHIFIKYLGKFKVFPSKIRKLMQSNDEHLQRGILSPEKHLMRQTFLKKRLVDLEQEDGEVEVELTNE